MYKRNLYDDHNIAHLYVFSIALHCRIEDVSDTGSVSIVEVILT